jgi:hypothetical protein
LKAMRECGPAFREWLRIGLAAAAERGLAL